MSAARLLATSDDDFGDPRPRPPHAVPSTTATTSATADTATVDRPAAARAVHDLLVALGVDPTDEGLVETPRRVAAAFESRKQRAVFYRKCAGCFGFRRRMVFGSEDRRCELLGG